MGVHVGEADGDHVRRLLCNDCDAHYETDETMTNECPECGLQDFEVCDDALPQLAIGDHVQDRDDDDEGDTPTMVVVGLPLEQADEHEVRDGVTVHDCNEDYPADDDVIEVAFTTRTDTDLDSTKRYAYPRSRLVRVASLHSGGGE